MLPKKLNKKVERETYRMGEDICRSFIDERFVSRINKELLKFNNMKHNPIKKWAKLLNRYLFEEPHLAQEACAGVLKILNPAASTSRFISSFFPLFLTQSCSWLFS